MYCFLCSKCKEVVLRKDEARLLREGAMANYRTKYGLLSGEEIKLLRERLNLSQIQLAELLRLGVNTISHWESGRNAPLKNFLIDKEVRYAVQSKYKAI